MSCDVINYALLGCAYTSELMRDERQSHISCKPLLVPANVQLLLTPLPRSVGELQVPIQRNVAWTEASIRTNTSRLNTIHQRYRQTDRTGQDNG